MPIGNPFGIGGGGVSQSQLDSIKPNTKFLIRHMDDIIANGIDVGTGIQLLNGQYIGDSDTGLIEITRPLYPAKTEPSLGDLNISWIVEGQWNYIGSGPLFQNNPDGEQHSALVIKSAILVGDGSEMFMDISDFSVGIGIFIAPTIQSFNGFRLKNMPDILIDGSRLVFPQGSAEFVDCRQININSGIHEITSSVPVIYKFSGSTEVLSIANSSVIVNNMITKIFSLSPTFNCESPQIINYATTYTAGATTGRLYTTDKTGVGTASNNGSGGVRIFHATPHALITGDGVRISGFNPYRYKVGGSFVENIDATNFDLLDDYGTVSIIDAGGGLLNITVGLKHRLVDGNSVIISGTTNYNATYVVSGVNIATPYLFQITETYVADESGLYKKPTTFTVAGDNLSWDSGSVNETIPGVISFLNGKEAGSTRRVVWTAVGNGTTALNNATWTKVAVIATNEGVGQRFTVANNGDIYSDSKRTVTVNVNGEFYGELSTGTTTHVVFSYLKNNDTVPIAGVTQINASLKNTESGKSVGASLQLNEGDKFYLAAKMGTGESPFNLTTSSFTGWIN